LQNNDDETSSIYNLTTPASYLPCQRQVAVFFDISNALSAASYTKLQNFMGFQFFAAFNHYERLTLGAFEALGVVSWKKFPRDLLAYIQDYVEDQKQSNLPADYEV
jgi:hypothetical protein